MEKLYEKQLKGKDGCDIKILDSDGEVKEVLTSIFKEDGYGYKINDRFRFAKIIIRAV